MKKNTFDWYQFSKLYSSEFDENKLKILYETLQNNHPSALVGNLQHVPLSQRKKLLLTFQKAEQAMHQSSIRMIEKCTATQLKKNALCDEVNTLQSQLSYSHAQLLTLKQNNTQKKKVIQRLKQKIFKKKGKIEKKGKNIGEQKYYCPLCNRNDFDSRDIFSFHMFSHYEKDKTNSNDSHQQLKQFILNLKDKEMELMGMLLKEKRNLQVKQLESIYEREIKKYLGDSKSNLQNQNQLELAGESQFIFYKGMVKETNPNLQYQDEQRTQLQYDKNPIKNELANNYYNCPSMAQQSRRQSEKMLTFNTKNNGKYADVLEKYKHLKITAQDLQVVTTRQQQHQPKDNFNPPSHKIYQSPQQLIPKEKQTQNPLYIELKSNRIYGNNLPKDSNQYLYHSQYQSQEQSSINGFSKAKRINQSIYSQRQVPKGYIFNAGILKDDSEAGDSDYEDYFDKKQKNCLNDMKGSDFHIQNEEITINAKKIIKNIKSPNSYTNRLNSSEHSSNMKRIHEKSQSCIVDLSADSSVPLNQSGITNLYDNLQKSELTSEINISDLKLSKLQRKKIEQRNKQLQQNTTINKEDNENKQILQNSFKKHSQRFQVNQSIISKKPLPQLEDALTRVRQQTQILDNFTKPRITTNYPKSQYTPQESILNEFMKQNIIPQKNKLAAQFYESATIKSSQIQIPSQQRTGGWSKGQLQQSNPGILNEFFKSQQHYQNTKRQYQEEEMKEYVS